ncbi:ankyrin repeat, SAM and basic leucine zipper domain-containing protein 1 isoform X3 [Larimichthys crocea]|uniref:ankyrin repeat, SAM and basic leucine zipper domain-containing protein 1 isoform X3 n=1 Tax=Larimichthys crocea TaxID=215358 RepID=UPI000F603BD6|nr:ankyrin repeat, SAM and basic leucine zipper domain-containing protein 1 isoform X3 [Larimichthys crocea]
MGSSFVDYAFPAGEESDASNDEWDNWPSEKPSGNKDPDAVVPDAADNVSMLKRAISKGNIGAVEQLLDNGMDVETRLGFEWTPLMCAVSVANYDLAKMLLDRGANASFNKDHWTVLMASTTASASEDKIALCVELLLTRNADPNMVDRSQLTCLMLAAREGYSKVINLLVSHGAEINVQDSNGFTALSIAVQYGRVEAVLKLLQLGADKTIRTNTGKSPADLAVTYKHTQISKILASLSQVSTLEAFSSMEETLSKLFKTNSELGPSRERSEDLHNFLISVRQQCFYLTEAIQDVVSRFPRQTSQLVFSLDPKKEALTVCNQLLVQTKDLQKEVTCLRSLLHPMDEAGDCSKPPQPGSHSNGRMQSLTRVALSTLGATLLLLLYKAASGKVYLYMNVC